ncbi:hypothetical protein CLU79DRAFT_886478 [Phycomyces nitens]|nr:hypothetical protein CLU79DRAFT_886478 [Phycomyces nitens]
MTSFARSPLDDAKMFTLVDTLLESAPPPAYTSIHNHQDMWIKKMCELDQTCLEMKKTIKDTQLMMQNLEDRFSRFEQVYPSLPLSLNNQPKYEPPIRAQHSNLGYISTDAALLSPTTVSSDAGLNDSLGRIGRSVEYLIAEGRASLLTTTKATRPPLVRTRSCPNPRDPFEFEAPRYPVGSDAPDFSKEHSTRYLHSEKRLAKAMDELFETVQAFSRPHPNTAQHQHTHQHIHHHIHQHNHFHFGQSLPAIRLPTFVRNAISLLKKPRPSPFMSNITFARLIFFLTLQTIRTPTTTPIHQISQRVCRGWSPLRQKQVFLLWVKWTRLLLYHLPLLRISISMKRDLISRL